MAYEIKDDEKIEINVTDKIIKKVLYICDRRACNKCDPECIHTSDISHAKNFELFDDVFVEQCGGVKMSRFINIGDKVIYIPTGIIGTVIKFYTPTASCEQTMVHTDDGRDYHAPTSEWARIGIDLASGEDCTVELLNPYGKYVCEFAKTHGISIDKAYDQPMVKARYEYFCKTGC